MAPQISEEDHKLISELFKLTEVKSKRQKLVYSSKYVAPADPGVTIRSWKLNEFRYYDVPSPFPTLARGLFTTWYSKNPKSEEGDAEGKHGIVARGYDKFFNIGEVPWCKWDALERHTSGPYVMTLKSNGCIIFIAALSQKKVLVTSKHSLGPVPGAPLSHAQAGEQWLNKQLEAKGKTVAQLASELWKNNWTAVAELCDDSFEEHVLSISSEKTGLHLHGINESCGAFKTLPSDKVAEFAREWGLIETRYHNVNSISEVRQFSDHIGKTGQWDGEPIEGFVVRCHVADSLSTKAADAPPYPPGSSFFFKVKYDEPYMTYRDWREITKVLLSRGLDANIPKSKLRKPESHLYLNWVREEIKKDSAQFKDYTKGHGIIATRERFLKWLKAEFGEAPTTEQLTSALKAMEKPKELEKDFGKTIIVPVAIPGCGKTTVAVALSHLFNFGHVQSDDMQGKKPAVAFLRRVGEELRIHDVVIADKNNHLVQHRQCLREAVRDIDPPVRLMALYWALEKPPAMVHRICSDRVLQRGENHQTLRPDKDLRHHEQAIWMFINNTEELADNEVDEVIEMDIEETMEESLDRAVDACVRVLGLPKPSREAVGEALAKARGYKVERKVDKQTKRAAKVRYYSLLPEISLRELVEPRVVEDDAHEDMRDLWEVMVKDKRVTKVPHVTLIHEKSLPGEQDLWDRCQKLFNQPSAPLFEFKLGHLVSDGRVMAATVEDVKVATNEGEDFDTKAQEFVDSLGDKLKDKLHITVGTRDENTKPFEARVMVESWKREKSGENVHAVPLKDIVVKGRVKGLMN